LESWGVVNARAHMVAPHGLGGSWSNAISSAPAAGRDKNVHPQLTPTEQGWRAWEVRMMAKLGAPLRMVLKEGIQPGAVIPTDTRTILLREHIHDFIVACLDGQDALMLAVSSN